MSTRLPILATALVAMAWGVTFPAQARQETITQATLGQHINSLRSRPAKSFIVSGPVVLDDATGHHETWYVDNLTFADGSALLLGSKSLTLNVRGQISVPSGKPVVFGSYPQEMAAAGNGEHGANGGTGQNGSGDGGDGATGGSGAGGAAGADGAHGGQLNLILGQKPAAAFGVALLGQRGGTGGNGGVGGRGGNGQRGRTADSGAFGCNRGGGDGGRGGTGGRGGDGGRAGMCGAGGEMMVLAPDSIIDELANLIEFNRSKAPIGNPGSPGGGGGGGNGGPHGHGSGFCGGGRGGSDGNGGASGITPPELTADLCSEPQLRFIPISLGS